MILDTDFFKIEPQNFAPQAGNILIAEPFSQDIYFRRSIVFLTEHNKNGSIGFILNKPVGATMSDLLSDFPTYFDAQLSIGGPVDTDKIYYIHTLGNLLPHSMRIIDNLYWGGDFFALKNMIRSGTIKPNQVRFFIGYSGWRPTQLETEISNFYWVISNLESEKIISFEKSIWRNTLSKMGKKYRSWVNTPESPIFN